MNDSEEMTRTLLLLLVVFIVGVKMITTSKQQVFIPAHEVPRTMEEENDRIADFSDLFSI